jgi:hypothetical protein
VYGEPALGDQRYSAIIIVPNRDSRNFAASQIMLDIAQDPFIYRTALIVGLEEFFGRVQIFGDALALVVDAGTPVAAFTARPELKAYLRRRLDAFINPLVYTFWNKQGTPSIMTMSSVVAE